MMRATSILAIAMCVNFAFADVLFVAHYNQNTTADFSAFGKSKPLRVIGAKITHGGIGFPFLDSHPSPEALDVGYTSAAPKGAGVYYDPMNIDVRQGTIELFIKSAWDWSNPDLRTDIPDRVFFFVPLVGDRWSGIRIYFACGAGVRYRPHIAFYIRDGKRDYWIGHHIGPKSQSDFNWRRNVWHYIVATWNPRRMRLFVDGRKVAERVFDVPMSIVTASGPICIGNAGNLHHSPANALIDEVRILDVEYEPPSEMPKHELPHMLPAKAIAAAGPATQFRPEPRRYYCYRVKSPPKVDGSLEDEVWRYIPVMSGFLSFGAERGRFVTEQTQVRACYDDRNLYIAVRCFDDAVERLRISANRRDDSRIFSDDAIEVFLSANRSGRPYVQLAVNANGICADLFCKDERRRDFAWNGRWRAMVRRDASANSWTVEIAIPFDDIGARPQVGSKWRFNICRDRNAGIGLQYSTMTFVTTGFHSPDEFAWLTFVGDAPTETIAQSEAKRLNHRYIMHVQKLLSDTASQVERELRIGKRLPHEAKKRIGLDEIERKLSGLIDRARRLLRESERASISDWNLAQLSLKGVRKSLDRYSALAMRSAPSSLRKLPPRLTKGIHRLPQCWLMVGDRLAVAIDPQTGALSGLWERSTQRRFIVGAFDIYHWERRTDEGRTDERLDEVRNVHREKGRLTFVCINTDLPRVEIRKVYYFTTVKGDERILCRRVELKGGPSEPMLVKLSSNVIFDEAFRERSFYERIFVIGTQGDPRSVIFAREIKEPIIQRAWFISTEGRAQFSIIDPTTETGLGHYLFKVNDRWAFPQGLASSYWTPYGWEMGYGGTFVKRGASYSAEVRFHLFHGDRITFHREYQSLPEYAKIMRDWTPHKDMLRIKACAGGQLTHADNRSYADATFGEANSWCRPNEIVFNMSGPRDTRWGEFPVGDDAEFVDIAQSGKVRSRFPARKLKENVALIHERYPHCRVGIYLFIWDIYKGSRIYREHPEWVLRDKEGNEVAGVWGATHWVQANWCPGYRSYLLKALLRFVDYYDFDFLYLDFSVGQLLPDWERGVVVQIYEYLDWLKRLHVELAKRGKFLWLNSFAGQPYFDMGFHECSGTHGRFIKLPWRYGASIDLMRKLYTRIGTVCIPLYWHGGDMFKLKGTYNEDLYRNRILALGLFPTGCYLDPYQKHFPDGKGGADWRAVFRYNAAVPFTAREMLATEFVDIGLEPAWWRDFETEFEAYTLRQGNAYFLNVISHYSDVRDGIFTLDAEKMGFEIGKPVFVWQHYIRDPAKFPKRAPALPNWERMFERYACEIFTLRSRRFKITLPKLIPGRVRICTITQVPAFIHSASGQRTQLMLPEFSGCHVSGSIDVAKQRVTLHLELNQPIEVFIHWRREWSEPTATVRYRSGRRRKLSPSLVKFGNQQFARIALDADARVVQVW